MKIGKPTKKIFLVSGAAATVLGIAIGAFMMHVAWEHNAPYGEIHSDNMIHWGYWLMIGFSWVIVVGISTFIILGVIPAIIVTLWKRFGTDQGSQLK
jgi:hypothetical protein